MLAGAVSGRQGPDVACRVIVSLQNTACQFSFRCPARVMLRILLKAHEEQCASDAATAADG